MVLFSGYFNGGLLVTRTIHVMAALSGGGHVLGQDWSGVMRALLGAMSTVYDHRRPSGLDLRQTLPPGTRFNARCVVADCITSRALTPVNVFLGRRRQC